MPPVPPDPGPFLGRKKGGRNGREKGVKTFDPFTLYPTVVLGLGGRVHQLHRADGGLVAHEADRLGVVAAVGVLLAGAALMTAAAGRLY